MEFAFRPGYVPTKLGILSGAFNPPTLAHAALAAAALSRVDQVLFVIPRTMPHKPLEGASLEERAEMLVRLTQGEERMGVAFAQGGLVREIMIEARSTYPEAELYYVCGQDAAHRVLTWTYEDAGAVEQLLAACQFLVAPRTGADPLPEHFSSRVHRLTVPALDEICSTEVRNALAAGSDRWKQLLDPRLHELALRCYGQR